MAERFSVKIQQQMDLCQVDTYFPSEPSYATGSCQSHLTHKVQVTYLQVTIWRCSRYMHSPWMQKFLYSISQGVPFFLFFPLFFFLLDLPAFFSPPLFVGLGLTTGSTEKKDKMTQFSNTKKLDSVKIELQNLVRGRGMVTAGESMTRKHRMQVSMQLGITHPAQRQQA